MNDYRELCETLRLANSWQFAPKFVNAMLEAADAIEQLVRGRDALKKKVEERCHICKHYNPSDWEWRGVQE